MVQHLHFKQLYFIYLLTHSHVLLCRVSNSASITHVHMLQTATIGDPNHLNSLPQDESCCTKKLFFRELCFSITFSDLCSVFRLVFPAVTVSPGFDCHNLHLSPLKVSHVTVLVLRRGRSCHPSSMSWSKNLNFFGVGDSPGPLLPTVIMG